MAFCLGTIKIPAQLNVKIRFIGLIIARLHLKTGGYMPERELAYAVIAQAIADALGKRIGGFSPRREEKKKALKFLRGIGQYERWLKFWCEFLDTDYRFIQKFAENIEGVK